MLVLISRLEGFDKSLEEASADLGEGAWGTFRRVTIPLALPGIVASLLLTTDALVSELPEKDDEKTPAGGHGHGH